MNIPEGFELVAAPADAESAIPEGFELAGAEGAPSSDNRGSAADLMFQGLTMGWGDEALSHALAGVAKLAGDVPENMDYDATRAGFLDELRGRKDAFAERNPKTAVGAEIAGGLLTGGMGLAKGANALARPASSALRKGAALSGVGAVEGAIYGAGSAEEGGRIEGAKRDAAIGAVAGPLVGYGIGKISDAIGNRKLVTQLLEDGVVDERTAGYMLKGQSSSAFDDARSAAGELGEGVVEGADGVERLALGGPASAVDDAPKLGGLRRDRLATDAMDQGWNNTAVVTAQRANPDTRRLMDKMVQIRKKIINEPRARVDERTGNVIGEAIQNRVDRVAASNKKAGQSIDNIANRELAGVTTEIYGDLNKVASGFMESLNNQNINILDEAGNVINASNRGGRPASLDFSDSNFADLSESKIIERVFNKLIKNSTPNAKDVHHMKRYIDNNISYGSDTTGAKRSAEAIIGDLRSGLDGVLDNRFPSYDKANRDYAKTIAPLMEIKRLAGKNTDIQDVAGMEKLGALARRMSSSAASSGDVRKAALDLDNVAKEFGYKGKESYSDLLNFENQMNDFLGTTQDTSFQGLSRSATKQGLKDAVGGEGIKKGIIDKLMSIGDPTINEDNAIDAMEKLIRRRK